MTRRNTIRPKITKSIKRNTNPTTTTPVSQLKITLYPPPVTKDDFLGRPFTNIDTKSPNAFFVYRKAFVKHLSDKNLKFRMTEVSKLVSYNWKNESKVVKDAYTKIAQEIDKEFQERKRIIRGYKIVCDPIMNDFLDTKEEENHGIKEEEKQPNELSQSINNDFQPSSIKTSPIIKIEESFNKQSSSSPCDSLVTNESINSWESDSKQYNYQPNLLEQSFVQSEINNCVCYVPTIAEGQILDPIWIDENSSCGYTTTCLNDFDFFNQFNIEQNPPLCRIENYDEYLLWNREYC
ncbi:3074_t:CDS:2 [Diversispora eburnea]|uniref:3074_t:CDS:1 n=1 Tax=Diversispora eburnea TaxID=1213867 RepID=A0A9N9BB82_9GLOM|nr:3074_t:CDS:2 [Diversispora eburnea]